MTVGDGLWVDDLKLGVLEARLAQSALWATNSSDALDVRTGLVFTGAPDILQATADSSPMTITLKAFHFLSTKGRSNGTYQSCSANVETLTVLAPPALGSKRTDLVWVAQRDKNAIVNADVSTMGDMGIVQGTATTGTPAKPALPAGTTEVGTITYDCSSVVPTKTSDAQVTLTTTGLWTVPRAVPIPVRNTTERAALTGYEGMRVMRLDRGLAIDVYTAGSWRDGDTGWITPTPSTGWTSSSLYPLEIRRQGNRVSLRGALVRGSGAGNALCSVPSGFRPAVNKLLNAVVSSGGAAVVTPNVATTGTVAITYQTTGVPVGDTLPLDAEWVTD